MNHSLESDLLLALDEAIRELTRAQREDWRLFDARPATDRLTLLSNQLESALRRVQAGDELSRGEFSGLVRWLTDWIPNVDDPLVEALGKVERAARAVAVDPR